MPTIAEDGNSGYPVQIYVDIAPGAELFESTIISGTFQDEVGPTSFTWQLLDSSGERHFVDLSNELVLQSETNGWNVWAFEIEIKPLEIGPCACTIVASSTQGGSSHSYYSPIFISPNSQQLPPTLHLNEDQSGTWASKVLTVNAISLSNGGQETVFEYKFSESPNLKCSSIFQSGYNDIDDLPEDLVLLNSSDVSFDTDSLGNLAGPISFELELESYEDGWYDLILFAIDPWNQRFSYDCISLRLDNTPPVVIIDGSSNISESDESVTMNGESSFDETWGIQGLTYIWTISDVSGISYPEMFYSASTDHRSIAIIPETSGNFEINLTVFDQAGNIGYASRNMLVYNAAPIVKLTIDGQPIEDNGAFTLRRDSTCTLDASGSTDTANDADSLRYIWRVNNIPTYEGPHRDLSWPEGVDNDFILTIEVVDDDMDSTKISVLVRDGDDASGFPTPILLLVISTIFLTYAIMNFRNNNQSDIPKWT